MLAAHGSTDLLLAVGLTVFITAEGLTRLGRRLTVPTGAVLGVAAVVAAVV